MQTGIAGRKPFVCRRPPIRQHLTRLFYSDSCYIKERAAVFKCLLSGPVRAVRLPLRRSRTAKTAEPFGEDRRVLLLKGRGAALCQADREADRVVVGVLKTEIQGLHRADRHVRRDNEAVDHIVLEILMIRAGIGPIQ